MHDGYFLSCSPGLDYGVAGITWLEEYVTGRKGEWREREGVCVCMCQERMMYFRCETEGEILHNTLENEMEILRGRQDSGK